MALHVDVDILQGQVDQHTGDLGSALGAGDLDDIVIDDSTNLGPVHLVLGNNGGEDLRAGGGVSGGSRVHGLLHHGVGASRGHAGGASGHLGELLHLGGARHGHVGHGHAGHTGLGHHHSLGSGLHLGAVGALLLVLSLSLDSSLVELEAGDDLVEVENEFLSLCEVGPDGHRSHVLLAVVLEVKLVLLVFDKNLTLLLDLVVVDNQSAVVRGALGQLILCGGSY